MPHHLRFRGTGAGCMHFPVRTLRNSAAIRRPDPSGFKLLAALLAAGVTIPKPAIDSYGIQVYNQFSLRQWGL